MPSGWQTQLGRNGAITAHSGDGGSWVIIAPIPNNGNLSAADWLRRSGAGAVGAYMRNASVVGVSQSRTSRTSALAKLEFATPNGPGTAHILCFMTGPVGTIYAIGGPSATYAQQQAALVAILQSFSFTGERAAAPREGGADRAEPEMRVSYTRFTDPRENSFSMEVPAGWRTEGGLLRKSTVDVRAFVFTASPDGSTFIHVGDPEVGSFTTPTQTLGMSGMREGSTYNTGYGNSMIIRRFVPGPQFAQEYVMRVTRMLGCSAPQMRAVKPLPQYSSRQNVGPALQTVSAGEADFSCSRGGQSLAGTVWAKTSITIMPGYEESGGLWTVPVLLTVVAPESRMASAQAILAHMLQTSQVSSAWFGQQQQTTAKTSQTVHETFEATSKIITDNYWSNQRAREQPRAGGGGDHGRQFDDYIRGTVRLRDPETGEELEGVAGKNYYYRVPHTNDNVGTNGTDFQSRNPDFRELEQIR